MDCLFSHPAGEGMRWDVSPTGRCLRPPVGAYVGRSGTTWYWCDLHQDAVAGIVCEHANIDDLPLTELSSDEAKVWEVMGS